MIRLAQKFLLAAALVAVAPVALSQSTQSPAFTIGAGVRSFVPSTYHADR